MVKDEETMNEVAEYLANIAKEITGKEDTTYCFILTHSSDTEGEFNMHTIANIDEATSVLMLREFSNKLEEHIKEQGTPDMETQH